MEVDAPGWASSIAIWRIKMMAFCGFGPMPVGDLEAVGEVFEDWDNNGDIDGFNVACEFTFFQTVI